MAPGPLPHFPPCNCILCLPFSKVCDCCGKEFKTWPSYRRHEVARKRNNGKRGPNNPVVASIVPDGDGFLKKVLANQTNLQKYNLTVLSRFCASLNLTGKSKRGRVFSRSHKNLLKELESGLPNTLHTIPVNLTEKQAVHVFRLARSVNTSPGNAASALVSYGLEYLSKELRQNASAPPISCPSVEKKIITERETASMEYLREQSPEQAKKVKEHVHIEIGLPRPYAVDEVKLARKSSFIPSTDQEV